MGLAGACLAVGKNADIMTFESALYYALHRAEDTLLIFLVIEDFVKLEP